MDVLHAIERAALDHVDGAPASLPLCRLADALGRTQIALTAARGDAGPVTLEESGYTDPDLLAIARMRFTTPDTNPLFKALPRFQPDRLFHFSTYTSWDAILSTPFYADFWEPSGVWHAGNYLARFAPDWGLCIAFGARRGREWYDNAETRLAEKGARQIGRAMRLRTEIEDARRAGTLEGNPSRFVLLVDRTGTILRAPKGARAVLLEMGLISKFYPERLIPCAAPLQKRMEEAVATAMSGGNERFLMVTSSRAILEFQPGPEYRHRRSAVVRIERIDWPRGNDWIFDMLHTVYGMTRREAEVVFGVCMGRTTNDIATELGLTVGSVRLYLKRAMPKARVHTQAQLVVKVLRGRIPKLGCS